ncbi:MAG: hypothetical protein KF742_00380 [Cryobacterium sp.]|nr:hypothetical protein [Cryobacterium sp.]MCO5293776.1 hypothetical protein [Homoserinimonas sp.]
MTGDSFWIALVTLLAVWILAALLQVVDVGTGHFVRRAGRTAGNRDRDRILTWMIAIGSILLVAVAAGVDLSLRLILGASHDNGESIELLIGSIGVVLSFAVAVVSALLISRALRRPQTGYQVLRDELRSQSGSRLSKGRIADYKSWLSAVDERQKSLSSKVAIGRVVRSIPVILAVVITALAIWSTISGRPRVWVIIVGLVACGLSIWLAVWGARISLARNLAAYAVHQKQRAEALLLIADLERKAPRRVAGLSERVSRALAILREQQGQQSQENKSR